MNDSRDNAFPVCLFNQSTMVVECNYLRIQDSNAFCELSQRLAIRVEEIAERDIEKEFVQVKPACNVKFFQVLTVHLKGLA